MRKPVTEAYVFAQSPQGKLERAGHLQVSRTAGTFTYAENWLTRSWAYPLDPVNLKLHADTQTVRNTLRVFPVFSDAGPDDWGTRVLMAGHQQLPANELERLLATNGHGVGCLQFSLSRTRPKQRKALPTTALLSELEQATQKIIRQEPVNPALMEILMPNTSVGGARPKVTLLGEEGDGEGKEYLAKFAKHDDPINSPRVEYATMTLARQCGIDIPDIHIHPLGERDAFLIRRFDRHGSHPDKNALHHSLHHHSLHHHSQHHYALHYLSAHSLFNRDKTRLYDDAFQDPCSYIALAKILRSHGSHYQEDLRQLYKRIIFNVYIGNTDDHGRNHGLTFDPTNPGWRLAKGFDIIPTISASHEQAMGVGTLGRLRSLENVRSAAPAFGLNEAQANQEIQQILDVAGNWEADFRDCGVSANDIQLLKQVISK